MTKLFLLSICNLLLLTAIAQTNEPILSLNSPMHTGRINEVSSDAEGRYLLTVSYDKTAKVWDANTGDLLKTFRPPIGQGNEGMLYTGALSPNGKLAAVAGYGYFDKSTHDIYIFNISTGELIQRLGGLDNTINDLEYSPDGKYLAASLAGAKGVVIYENSLQSRYEKYKTLTGYVNRSQSVAFDLNGRLATVSYDGKIRLYDNRFNLIKQTTGAGNKPFSIAFSPDGEKIAVGYVDSPDIDVFSGKKLKLLYKPALDGMKKNGGLMMVSFSQDGKYLYGGHGHWQKIDGKFWRVIRQWANAGRGGHTDYPACGNTIRDIKAKPNGDLLFAGTQPDFGRMNVKGDKLFYKTGEINNYKANDKSHFKINAGGDKIAFTSLDKAAMQFSVTARTLSLLDNLSRLESPSDQKSGIQVTELKSYNPPKINGRKITFWDRRERSYSTDISPGGNKIVIGASWNIYCADSDGSKLWKTAAASTTFAVNIAQNGEVVATAEGDGLIKWYRMDDGALVLSLYAHPDNKRWVLFTPGGYYDASPGAEALFGWHLNQDADSEAYFFPASKFRNKYYRPDVIDNILNTLNEEEALRIADLASNRKNNDTKIVNMLPPVVSIQSPSYNQEVTSTTLNINYTAVSPKGEPISNVKFMIDGRPVETQRGFIKVGSENSGQKTITIPQRDVILQVLAENQHGWSVPAEVRLKWKGHSNADILKPTLYVLAIGVSDYQNNDYDLDYAAKDAKDFAAAIQLQKGRLYKGVETKILTDAGATKNDILDGLDWIQKECTARDMAMIFVAGHGINDNVGTFYYLPHEADVNSLRRSSLMFTELKYTTSAIAGKVVMFVDACHSGDVMGGRRSAPDVNSLVNELSDVESGAVVFTSSTGKQFSLEDAKWGNGAFTEALIEGINGKADLFGNGTITVKALDAYIAQRVKELTGGKQSPTMVIPQSMPDFPIGVVK